MERLFQANGPIRRSLLSGLIFVFVFFFHYFLLVSPQQLNRLNQPNPRAGTVTLKDVIHSSQLLIVAAGFVFAAGAVIDAMTDGFIVRGVSTTRSIHACLADKWDRLTMRWFRLTDTDKDERARQWLGILFNLASFFFWPPVIVVCTILSSSDHYELYRVGLKEKPLGLLKKRHIDLIKKQHITKAALRIFENTMPLNMQEALDTPFCNQFDAAWQGLLTMLPEAQHQWVISLRSRNRDLVSFLASGFFALAISTGCLLFTGRGWSVPAGASYVLLCVLSWFLFGYVSLVVRSVCGVLELVAVTTSSFVR